MNMHGLVRRSGLHAGAIAIFIVTAPMRAAVAGEPSLEFDAKAGYRYDSNVSLAELDTNTGEADNALQLELGVDGKAPLTKSLSVAAGYGYTSTAYSEFSEFDTAIHRLHGELQWQAAGLDMSLALRHFGAALDGERYLDIRQVSPSVARLFGRSLYLRGALTESEKTYADNPGRDANSVAFDVDAYWLLDGMDRYVSLGYRLDSEDASDAELDYDGNRIKLAFGQQLDSLPVKIKASVQVENRDYLNETGSIDAARSERRMRTGVNANWQFTEHFHVEWDATYADHDSNLPSAHYDEVVFGINVGASF